MTLEEVQARHREVMAALLELEDWGEGTVHYEPGSPGFELLREMQMLNRLELAMTACPDYFCGSNYCDDPACQQEHRESL